jgi:hypothetical protein
MRVETKENLIELDSYLIVAAPAALQDEQAVKM